MTLQEAIDVVAGIEMKHAPFKVRLKVDLGSLGGYRTEPHLCIIWHVPHRDTGAMVEVRNVDRIPMHMDPEQFVRFVLHMVERAFVHEAREAFHYNGVRIADPHAGGRQ